MTRNFNIAAIASMDIVDILRPKSPGEQVNSTVQTQPREPQPDYEAMRRLANGETTGQFVTHDRILQHR